MQCFFVISAPAQDVAGRFEDARIVRQTAPSPFQLRERSRIIPERVVKMLATGEMSLGCIGPELEFGTVVGDRYAEPVLLIKTAWGGKSLHTDFRPASAGPYVFNEAQLADITKRGKDVAEAKAKDKIELSCCVKH